MFFDPLYILVMIVGGVLSGGAALWVKSSTSKWEKVPIGRGMTGKMVAEAILRTKGIRGVTIEEVPGRLSDHYDPRNKTLRLSPANYRGRSVTAAGIAAHEVGHAIQHAEGYAPMKLRQDLVPIANIGSSLGIYMVMFGAFLGISGLAKLGVFIFAGFVLFTLVTLPVEIDASLRARKALIAGKIVSGKEAQGVQEILTAAAATYLAAAVTAILQLLYWALRAGLIGGSRDD
ncbi:MAG: peptidase [Proteobacteria bacterium]|nr:peptidase [Pseudomonadota bacterium]